MTVASAALPMPAQQLAPADYTLDIAGYELKLARGAKSRQLRTTARCLVRYCA